MHKHYIEHLSNPCYRFIKENFIAIIIVIILSPSPSCMLVIVGMNTISNVFLNTLIWARQKSIVLSLTLIFLQYFYIVVLVHTEPSLVQNLAPGWLQI